MRRTPRIHRPLGAALILASTLAGRVSTADPEQATSAPSVAESWACPEEMHATFVRRFETSPGFGFARMPTTLRIGRSGELTHEGTRYAVDRLELIGWLQREEPVVYVSAGHGPGPILLNASTREPTAWEAESMRAVRADGRIVCEHGDDSPDLRCVGPLRAKPACLQCHSDRKEGDVLGALSYTLRTRAPAGDGP